jgi:hypothetical protein
MEDVRSETPQAEEPEAQLRLIGTPDGGGTWRLSRATREVGRRGVAQARAALQAARGNDPQAARRTAA